MLLAQDIKYLSSKTLNSITKCFLSVSMAFKGFARYMWEKVMEYQYKFETHKEKDEWKLYKYLMNKGLFCTLVVIISFHSYLLEMKSFIVWKFSKSSLLSFCKIVCFEKKFLDIKQNIWLDLLGNRLEENNLVVIRIPFYLTTQYFDLCLRTD